MFDILILLKVNEHGKGAFTTRRVFFGSVEALLFFVLTPGASCWSVLCLSRLRGALRLLITKRGVSMGSSNREPETMISAGIDIGTSTTKLIISRFSLMNVAGTTHVPKIEIVDKEVLYKSPFSEHL